MLINKGVSAGEVVTVKLSSGEELVAKLIEDSADHYKLSKIMVLSITPQGMGMMPYIFTVDHNKDIKLSKNNVVVIEATEKQFADQYIQSTTGIKLA